LAALEGGGIGMTVPEALGIRIYGAPNSFDLYVTQYVSDFSYRSVVPRGFSDASFKFNRYTPIGQPDATIWTPPTSAASSDNQTFKVTDANAALINTNDRFWVYTSGGAIRMNGDRFTVTGKSSSGGTTTVSYAPASSAPIASGDVVLAKVPASFYDTNLFGFNKMIALFNRIQVIDLRTMEIAWEGRIEQPARESDKDTWTLGVKGTSAFADDIRRPMFYLDDQLDSWTKAKYPTFNLSEDTNNGREELQITFVATYPWDTSGTDTQFLRRRLTFQKIQQCDLYGIGRFDAIWNGDDGADISGKLGIAMQAEDWSGNFGTSPVDQRKIASRFISSATIDQKIFRAVGTGFADNAAILHMAAGYIATSGAEATVTDLLTDGRWKYPRVQPQRMDRFRTRLNTAASYPDGALRPYQVVEDVLGRFLNGGHDRLIDDNPYPGYVNPYTAYVDTSSTVLMINGWTFYDGVTAAEILDKICDEAQTTAYWAIWESRFTNTDDTFQSKCDFEFVNWPNSWGYLLTSEDGITEQPSANDEYSFAWYQYTWDTENPGYKHIYTYWNTNLDSELDQAQITRATFLQRDQTLGDFAPAITEIRDFFTNTASRVKNAGSIKISRPVPVFDPGVGRPYGMARMLDPWMVRPGKLGKVTDIEPKASMNDFAYGNNAPSRETDGTIFRMVGVEYDSASNTATVDLDQNQTWNIPNQIVTPKPGKPVQGPYYR
jgi:hypothetical protein